MRKLIALMLLMSILLASCNFPLTQSTPDPALVATGVAATLTAASPDITATPQNQATASLPTVALNTLEPSATSTITPTATTPPGDPRLTLGTPGFTDTFTSGTAFGLAAEPYEDDAVIIEVINGTMQFTSSKINAGKRWRLTSRNPQNLYLEGTFRTTSCSGDDQYGLVFRAPTYSDGIGYYFGVTCDGKYFLQRMDASDMTTLVSLTTESNILSGSGQVNRLGVWAENKTIKLYVNGKLIKEITDDGLVNQGYIGAFTAAYDDPGLTVQLEEISLWPLQ